ncbi:hypothetical protein [Amycolatopsis sp. NPDC059657]|uniref:zinc finger domain-containing protein n=1 Tax=Amycolatopsis sp. NPDC059657 TaxID=3346899 RepID=UPI003671FDEC
MTGVRALARTVPCPFCPARKGRRCTPLSRNRLGVRDTRDPVTRMHTSRLRRAQLTRAATTRHSTDWETTP